MPHFCIFLWETLDHSNEEKETKVVVRLDEVLVEMTEDRVVVEVSEEIEEVMVVEEEEVLVETEADLVVEETEEIYLNVTQFVQNVEKIVKFLLNQLEISRFIAVHVSVQVLVAEKLEEEEVHLVLEFQKLNSNNLVIK
jgi:hypothetical protein